MLYLCFKEDTNAQNGEQSSSVQAGNEMNENKRSSGGSSNSKHGKPFYYQTSVLYPS